MRLERVRVSARRTGPRYSLEQLAYEYVGFRRSTGCERASPRQCASTLEFSGHASGVAKAGREISKRLKICSICPVFFRILGWTGINLYHTASEESLGADQS